MIDVDLIYNYTAYSSPDIIRPNFFEGRYCKTHPKSYSCGRIATKYVA